MFVVVIVIVVIINCLYLRYSMIATIITLLTFFFKVFVDFFSRCLNTEYSSKGVTVQVGIH